MSATVNLATERATVTGEPSVTVAQIVGAVEAAGSDARLVTDQGEEPAQQVGAVARGSRCGDDRPASSDCLALPQAVRVWPLFSSASPYPPCSLGSPSDTRNDSHQVGRGN